MIGSSGNFDPRELAGSGRVVPRGRRLDDIPRVRQDHQYLRGRRHRASPSFSAYATAKAGLVRFSETLAVELAEPTSR